MRCQASYAVLPSELEEPLSTVLVDAGTLFTERGTIRTVFFVCYALTSFVGGYVR